MMNLADKLNILMKKNNIRTPKELSNQLNQQNLKIPYTTLLTIINNEVQDIKLGTARKLCDFFNITLDELLDDNIDIIDTKAEITKDEDLTPSEVEELHLFMEFIKYKRGKQ